MYGLILRNGRIKRLASCVEGGAEREMDARGGLVSVIAGPVVTRMFLFVSPLQGPAARMLDGLDLSWLAGLLYYGPHRAGFGSDRGGVWREIETLFETETRV